MATSDYNKKKEISPTSQNDSGTTQDKAQPIILKGNDFTGIDGFESGSSQLNWESNLNQTGGTFSIDSNAEIYSDNSLKVSSNGSGTLDKSKSLNEKIDSDGKKIEFTVKIDNQTGDSSEAVNFFFNNSVGDKCFWVSFLGNGDITDGNGTTLGSWNANTIIDIRAVVDFTNNEFDLIKNGSTIASNVSFHSSSADITDERLTIDNLSGATINAFIDNFTYTSAAEDTTNAGGEIALDWANISSESDIAVYDQNGNLLPYEIESFDINTSSGSTQNVKSDGIACGGSTISGGLEFKKRAILKEVNFRIEQFNSGDSPSSYTVRLKDSNNNVYVSKSKTPSNSFTNGEVDTTITFTESDYNLVPVSGDVLDLEVELSNTDQTVTGTGEDDYITADLVDDTDENKYCYPNLGSPGETTMVFEERVVDSASAVLWAYNSWVRDDSVQAQVVYGDGPASSEENVSGTWDNTGQNAEMVQHFNEDNYPTDDLVDSTSNNFGSAVTGATSVSSSLDGAIRGDGTDDHAEQTVNNVNNSDLTLVTGFKTSDQDNPNRFAGWIDSNNGEGIEFNVRGRNTDTDPEGRVVLSRYDGNSFNRDEAETDVSQLEDGNEHLLQATYDISESGTGNAWGATVDGSTGVSNREATASGNTIGTEGWFILDSRDIISPDSSRGPLEGDLFEMRVYSEIKSSDWIQADYDASPKAGQVFFSQSAAKQTLAFNGATTTANASGTGETISISGSTTIQTTSANATGSGATIFIEPDFGTLSANGAGTGATISISGSSTLDITEATATGAGGTSNLTEILVITTASATGTGSTLEFDRLSGTVDVEGQPTSGVDVNVVDKTNNLLYETTTDSNGDWIVDSGDGVVYQVAYLFDDGTTYYGDAEQSDTT